jgi:hypothetical protein
MVIQSLIHRDARPLMRTILLYCIDNAAMRIVRQHENKLCAPSHNVKICCSRRTPSYRRLWGSIPLRNFPSLVEATEGARKAASLRKHQTESRRVYSNTYDAVVQYEAADSGKDAVLPYVFCSK